MRPSAASRRKLRRIPCTTPGRSFRAIAKPRPVPRAARGRGSVEQAERGPQRQARGRTVARTKTRIRRLRSRFIGDYEPIYDPLGCGSRFSSSERERSRFIGTPVRLLRLRRAAENFDQAGQADSRFADAAASEQRTGFLAVLRANFQARPERRRIAESAQVMPATSARSTTLRPRRRSDGRRSRAAIAVLTTLKFSSHRS